jgi:hypothetical protein
LQLQIIGDKAYKNLEDLYSARRSSKHEENGEQRPVGMR